MLLSPTLMHSSMRWGYKALILFIMKNITTPIFLSFLGSLLVTLSFLVIWDQIDQITSFDSSIIPVPSLISLSSPWAFYFFILPPLIFSLYVLVITFLKTKKIDVTNVIIFLIIGTSSYYLSYLLGGIIFIIGMPIIAWVIWLYAFRLATFFLFSSLEDGTWEREAKTLGLRSWLLISVLFTLYVVMMGIESIRKENILILQFIWQFIALLEIFHILYLKLDKRVK